MTKYTEGDRVNYLGNDPATPGTVTDITAEGIAIVKWDDGWSDGRDAYLDMDLVPLEPTT